MGRVVIAASAVITVAAAAFAADPSDITKGSHSAVGLMTAVQGNVFAARPEAGHPVMLERHHRLYERDVLHTLPRSRAKALLDDDTLLALGEDTRVQILERLQDASRDTRILVMRLTHGRVRVVVGRRFAGPASRVELQTPTGVVSANEGSFAAWIDSTAEPSGSMGVTNIGRAPISFTAAGQMVTLISGQSSTAHPRRPPVPPELLRTALNAVNRAVQETQLRDRPKPQSPRETLLATGRPDTELRTRRPAAGRQSGEPPLVPITPPAVISGAASGEAPQTQTASAPAPAPAPIAPAPAPPRPAPTITADPRPSIPTPPRLPTVSTNTSRNRGRD
jgi:hypothetical protein